MIGNTRNRSWEASARGHRTVWSAWDGANDDDADVAPTCTTLPVKPKPTVAFLQLHLFFILLRLVARLTRIFFLCVL